jgi:hypothetical protein
VADHEDPRSIPTQQKVIEESSHTTDGCPPALPARIRRIEVPAAIAMQLGRGGSVLLPIITFPQSPVVEDRQPGVRECDGRGLERSAEVGREDGCEPVVSPPSPKLSRLSAA